MSKIYTDFMQQLLGSITESMTKLLDMNEECRGSPTASMPDMVSQSKQLEKTLLEVVKFMKKEKDGTDSVFDESIPDSLETTTKGAALIVNAMEILNGTSNDKGHALVDEGANCLMLGTVKMLDLYDDKERRVIISACQGIKQGLEPLPQIEGVINLITCIKSLSPLLVKGCKLASEREGHLKPGPHRVAMDECIQTIRKGSVALVTSLRNFCTHKDLQATVSRDFHVTEINNAVDRLIYLINMRYYHAENFCPGGDFALALENVINLTEEGSNGALFDDSTTKGFDNDFNLVMNEACRIHEASTDSFDADRLGSKIATSKKLYQDTCAAAVEAKSGNEDSKGRYQGFCERLNAHIMNLGDDLLRMLAKEKESAAALARALAEKLMEESRAHSVAGTEEVGLDLLEATEKLNNVADSVARHTADGVKGQVIRDARQKLVDYTPVLTACAQSGAKHHDDPNSQKAAELAKDEWDRRFNKVLNAMDMAQQDVGLVAMALEKRIGELLPPAKSNAKHGNREETKCYKTQINHLTNRLQQLCENEAENVAKDKDSDSINKAKILNTCKTRICDVVNEYNSTLDSLSTDKNSNPCTLDAHEKNEVKLLNAAADARLVLSGNENLDELEARLEAELKEAERKRLEQEEMLRKQMEELRRKEEERLRREIEAQKAAEEARLNALEEARRAEAERLRLIEEMKKAKEEAETKRLAEEAEKARIAAEKEAERLRLEEEEARRLAEEAAKAERARIVEENRVITYEQPKSLDVADNDMGKGARDLYSEANKWDDSENDLIALVKKISETFAEMSSIKDDVSKKSQLIQLSKSIHTDSKKVSKIAIMFAKACTENRLSSNLNNSVNKIETIVQQLKVVTMVKSSMPHDISADQQLTVCAGNLMNAVKESVNQCHSCSIKSAPGSVQGVKWRKMVYRR